jgi:hypothetical protein
MLVGRFAGERRARSKSLEMACFTRLRMAAAAAILCPLGCRSPGADACVAESQQAIYGGSPDAVAAGLDDSAPAAAVAAIVTESEAGPPELCSGVLVASRFVLTAAHCAPGAAPAALRVTFGPSAAPFADGDPCAAAAPSYPVITLVRDPNADVMLVGLAGDVPAPTVPIAMASPVVGQAAVISGYGLNAQGTAGERLFVATTVVAHGPGILTIDSGADAGACAGDSGGPLFVRGASGWDVAGVLSQGSAYCTGEDQYVDITTVTGWIAANVRS